MVGLILVLIGVAVFFSWYKKKKQGNTSAQGGSFEQGNSCAPFKNASEKQRYEMIYGLLVSSNGTRRDEEVMKFINFNRPLRGVNQYIELFDLHKYFRWSGSFALLKSVDDRIGYDLSRDDCEKIFELNKKLDESWAYRYFPADADKICAGKASHDSVIPMAELFSNELIKQYYTIVSALLETMKTDSIDSHVAKKYIEYHTKQSCDSQKLEYALAFTKVDGAKERVTSDEINEYKCSKYEAYSICYPDKYNETVKQYYTIVSALLETMQTDSIDSYAAKKYIEYHTKQTCDDQKLKYALEFTKEKGAKEKFGIAENDINKYKCSMQEAYSICYSDMIESVKADCKEIFNIVASYGETHFEEGLSKKTERYENKIGSERTQEFFRQAIQEMYFDGNDTVKTSLYNRINQYSYDARMREYYRLCIESVDAAIPTITKYVAAIMLRALHFEKHGQNREEYKAITENDCREFISNCECIQREIENEVAKDPFNTNPKKLINIKANEIFDIFESIKTNVGWYLPRKSENYYADSLCNGFLKWIVEAYQKEYSTDPNVTFEILLTHFKPKDSDFEYLANERQKARERQEQQARDAAIRRQQYEQEAAIRRQTEEANRCAEEAKREAKYEKEMQERREKDAAWQQCKRCTQCWINHGKCRLNRPNCPSFKALY